MKDDACHSGSDTDLDQDVSLGSDVETRAVNDDMNNPTYMGGQDMFDPGDMNNPNYMFAPETDDSDHADMHIPVSMLSPEMHDSNMTVPVSMLSPDMHDSDMDDPIYMRSADMDESDNLVEAVFTSAGMLAVPKDGKLAAPTPTPNRTLEMNDMNNPTFTRIPDSNDSDDLDKAVQMTSVGTHDDMDNPTYVQSGEVEYESESRDGILAVPTPKRTLQMNDDVLAQPPVKPEKATMNNTEVMMRALTGNGILKKGPKKDSQKSRLSVENDSRSNSIRRKDKDSDQGNISIFF